MTNFSHFKQSRKKGVAKGCFYSLLIIIFLYLLHSDILASLIFPAGYETLLESKSHSGEKPDLFLNPIRILLLFSFGYVSFKTYLFSRIKCREYKILGNFVDSLSKEKIAKNYTSFAQDLENALVDKNLKNQQGLTQNIQWLLDGSLNKEIIDCYQNCILSLTLLISFFTIILTSFPQ